MKTWECFQCSKKTRGKRRWCFVYGPVYYSAKKGQPRPRVAVCAPCKKVQGVFV